MKLIITIDTEEDDWGQYDLRQYGLQNIERIGALQDLFDSLEAKPTYLVTYPVATGDKSVRILKSILEGDGCEIGTHCHPWNTPPFEEPRDAKNSMLCNLSADQQREKISNLHRMVADKFDRAPTSFRAGRWGFNNDTAQILQAMNYRVDSSILAYQDWRDYGGPDYSNISPGIFLHAQQKPGNNDNGLLEVPGSAGFTRDSFQLCDSLWQLLDGKYVQRLHPKGVLRGLGILNKVWLSPETSTASEMIRLLTTMMHQNYQVANMFFHSTALKAGLSPFVQTKDDENQFLRRVEDFLTFTHRAGIESIKLSDVPAYVQSESIALRPNDSMAQ